MDNISLVSYPLDKDLFRTRTHVCVGICYADTRIFFLYPRISMGTRGYLQNKILIFNKKN